MRRQAAISDGRWRRENDVDVHRIWERAESIALPSSDVETPWTLSSPSLRLLTALIRETEPRTMLELGSGRSTVLLAKELAGQAGAQLLSVEHDAAFYRQTLELLGLHQVQTTTKMVQCRLRPTVRRRRLFVSYGGLEHHVSGIDPVDLCLIDGPPGCWGREAPMYSVYPYLRWGAVIVLDDAFRGKERQAVEDWIAYYNGGLRLEGTLPLGKGMAILTKQDVPSGVGRGRGSLRADVKISSRTLKSLARKPSRTKRDLLGQGRVR